MDSTERRTSPGLFPQDHRDAWLHYVKCGHSMVTLDEDELDALWVACEFQDEILAEKKRRKRAAAEAAEWRKTQAQTAAAQRPAAPRLSKEEQSALLDQLHKAFVAAVDTGESGPLITFLEKQHSNVHGSMVSCCLAILAVHTFHMRGKRRELEDRVKALEAREPAAFPDKGVWTGLHAYQKNDCVTDKGSFWSCRAAHVGQRPGSAGAATFWRLAAKGGIGVKAGDRGGVIDAADLKL